MKITVLLLLMMIVGLMGLHVRGNEGITPYNIGLKYVSDAKGDWAYPNGLVKNVGGLLSTSYNDPEVIFFGDSYVEQYAPRMVNLYQKGLIKEVGFVTAGGCAPLPNSYRSEDRVKDCNANFNRFEKVLELSSINTIILGGAYPAYYSHDKGFYMDDGVALPLAAAEVRKKSMREFFDFVERLSKRYKVVVMSHTPASKYFSPDIILGENGGRSFPLSNKIKNKEFSIDYDLELEMAEMANALGVAFISQSSKICPNKVCVALTEEGMPKYKDTSHMRPFYVIRYMDILDEFVLSQ